MNLNEKFTHRNFDDPAFEQLALSLGKIALAWNDLHIVLSDVFWAASKFSNALIPGVMWFSIKSDRAQRDMLDALVKSPALGNPLSEAVREELGWVLGQARKIEDLRNDFLHSPFVKSGNEIVPFHLGIHVRALKLSDKDLLHHARWFYETTITLRDYASEIANAVRDARHVLPDRPALPNRGRTNKTQQRPQEQPEGYPRSPRSSQA